jgi:transcriptional regulator
MLVHPWDAGANDDEWRELVASQPFGLLIAPGRDRDFPAVTPAPVVVDGDVVRFHLARPNPVWRALEENDRAMIVVTADDAFVPSAWKAIDDEDPALGIPTWYYAAVEVTGRVTIHDEDAAIADLLRVQLAAYEPGSAAADPSVHRRRLPGIRAATLSVVAVEAKFKFGGNVDDAHRRAVALRLDERDGRNDAAAAARVRRRTPAG